MKYSFSLLLICAFHLTFAQKGENEYFFKNNGSRVYAKDSADFIRVIIKSDSSASNSTFKEYFKNGNVKRTGTIVTTNPVLIKLDGLVTDFYQNGNKKSISTYKADTLVGESMLYYENGALNEKRLYTNSPKDLNVNDKLDDDKYFVKYKSDSLGHSFLDANGSGDFKITYATGDYITGTYLNGLKHSNWERFDSKDDRKVQETYLNGQFIKGETILASGMAVSFQRREVRPEFPGGLKALGTFVTRNFKYSKTARKQGVEGKVILSFVIDKEGNVVEVKILRNLGLGTGEEGARVLSRSPKWKPGYQYGMPVRVAYTLPIALKLDVE